MLLCIIVGGTMNNKVNTFRERFEKGILPQFIYIDGELLIPMPDGGFIYFPVESTHKYLSKNEFEDKLRFAAQVYTSSGTVMLPRQKC